MLECGIYPGHTDVRWSHHIQEDFEARLATLCIIHSFSGSNALIALPHHGWDTIMGQFLTYFSYSFFIPCYWEWLEDVLGRNKERLVEWRLYHGLYASLFSYDMSANIFKSFYELWCHTSNTFCTESGDMSISL